MGYPIPLHVAADLPPEIAEVAERLTCEVLWITPEIAAQLLEGNTANRPVSTARVRQYAEAIGRGEWLFTGETIILDKDGLLLNGQHRLMAVRQADRAIPCLVVYGIDRRSTDEMDQNMVRSLAGMLHMRGYRNTTLLASTAAWLFKLYQGPVYLRSFRTPTRTQGLDLVAEHPSLPDTLRRVSVSDFRAICPSVAQFAAFVHMLTYEVGGERAETFITGVVDGEGLVSGDPRLAMRQRYLRIRMEQAKGLRTTSTHVTIYLIRAWNAHHAGRKTTRLTLPSQPEGQGLPIPRIRGWRDCPWPEDS